MGPKHLSIAKRFLAADDPELVSRLVHGDGDALAALFKRHGGMVFRIARGIVGDDAEAEEAVQQIFLEVYRDIEDFDRQRGSFKNWLFHRAFSRAVDWRKHLQAQRFYVWDEIDETMAVKDIDPLLHLLEQDQSCLIEQLLSRLPTGERSTIKLKFFTGLTLREIADKTRKPLSSVASALNRSLRTLRTLLMQDRPLPGAHHRNASRKDNLVV